MFFEVILVLISTQSVNCVLLNYTDAKYDPAEPPYVGVNVSFNFVLIGIDTINEEGAVCKHIPLDRIY